MTPTATKSARKQTSIFLGLRTDHIWRKPINLTTYYNKIIRFIRSFVQSVAPRIPTEIIKFTCRFPCSRGHSCMQMAVEKPNLTVFSYKFQAILNSSVFKELTKHTESKMIINFTSGLLQSLRLHSFGVIRISDPKNVWIMVHQRNR